MTQNWNFLIDFCFISCGLLLATALRAKVPTLQKFLIPNNIIAGFLCLLAGDQFIGLYDIAFDRFGNYVYHLLALTFIALGLKKVDAGTNSRASLNTGFILSIGYGVQCMVGLFVTLVFMQLWNPDLFPTFGYFLMLGFGQGPGQAFSLGQSWEPLGFVGAANIGLTFAAIGFLWASIVGIALVNYGLWRRGKLHNATQKPACQSTLDEGTGLSLDDERQVTAGRLTTHSSAIDSLTVHIAIILAIYLSTFLLLKGLSFALSLADIGSMSSEVNSIFWGMHYIFASLLSLLFRRVIHQTKYSAIVDNGMLNRIAGMTLDFMVTAAIAAISIGVFIHYQALILSISTLGGLATTFFVIHAIRHANMPHSLERLVSIFGTLTGNLSTGVTLNRIIDPDFKTGTSQHLVLGVGFSVPFSFFYFASLLLPLAGVKYGEPFIYTAIAAAAVTVFTLVLYIVWRIFVARAVTTDS